MQICDRAYKNVTFLAARGLKKEGAEVCLLLIVSKEICLQMAVGV